MRCVYWNTKDISNLDSIIEIIQQEKPDLFFLAETDIGIISKNIHVLNGLNFEHFPNPGCERIIILKRETLSINLGLQTKYYTTVYFPLKSLFIISVHLPSQYHQSLPALKAFIRTVREQIDKQIGNSSDTSILLMGDFNVNPFETPMIDFDGFAATNTRNFRKKITRSTVEQSLYYNPTWQLYSQNHFPGTHYYGRPSSSSFDVLEHHLLDQVVLSSQMSNNLISEKITIIEYTKSFNFLNRGRNRVEISDHLPLMYEFDLI